MLVPFALFTVLSGLFVYSRAQPLSATTTGSDCVSGWVNICQTNRMPLSIPWTSEVLVACSIILLVPQKLYGEDWKCEARGNDSESKCVRNKGVFGFTEKINNGTLQHWRWRQCVPPNRWYLHTSPHGVTMQKNDIDNNLLHLCCIIVNRTLALKMEAVCYTETIYTYRSARHCYSGDRHR
jgi:hypothetical protein